ncbi:MAG TPA: N-acetylglucosamine-6-phosphate deacetylase [Limnochordia bacterium]
MGGEGTIFIRNGTLLDPSGEWIPGGCLLAHRGRIAFAGPERAMPTAIRRTAGAAEELDAREGYIVPGFIDLHVHGGGGKDTMDATLEALAQMAAAHAARGTTGFLATTMTAPQEALVAAARAVAAAISHPPAEWRGAQLLGLHLEGPYINPEKKGAQNAAFMRPPDREELDALLAILGSSFRRITLAPELPGAADIIPWLVERGVGVSLGHTAATFEETLAAVDLGARYATHTFNAMSGLHHRQPGVVGAVMAEPRLTAELINDGVHVHPGAAKALIRAKGFANVTLVTDAIRAMGLPDGTYELGGLEVRSAGGAVRLPDGTLAGSVLDMGTAVKNAVQSLGVPLAEAVRMASGNPARAAGVAHRKGQLAVGYDADVVVLDAALAVSATVIGGVRIEPKEGAERPL